MKYGLITGGEPEPFVERVNAALADGWQPLGGVMMAATTHGTLYVQALTHPQERAAKDKTLLGDALSIKSWLLAHGASVGLANAVGFAFTGRRVGYIITQDGVICLVDGITPDQFRLLCANPANTIQISRVGVAGQARLRAICQAYVNGEGTGHA